MAVNTESDHSDTASFKSAEDSDPTHVKGADASTAKVESDSAAHNFTPEEEASLLEASNDSKSTGNSFFARAEYSDAIQFYDKALGSCPNYLDYEIAVLRANVAACHLKMQEWQEAVDSATKSLECLERLDPTLRSLPEEDKDVDGRKRRKAADKEDKNSGVVQEVDDETVEKIEALEKSGRTREEVLKIRTKALMRRAKGREELGGWGNLQGAEEDYKELFTIPTLSPLDHRTVQRSRVTLPSRIEAAKQREMGEMMGKLKDLGNGILKPFGLSTDNFQFTKDENSGGYSMQFDQNRESKE